MKIESLSLRGFRCFSPDGIKINFEDRVTALVGGNGTGKTAVLLALLRVFGVTSEQRRVRRCDFHLPHDQREIPSDTNLFIDVVLSFPEIRDSEGNEVGDAVPEFFRQMAVTEPGGPLKARIVLKATWIDDGTPSGSIDEDIRWVRTLDEVYDWDDDCQKVSAVERGTVQIIYVSATRNVQEQVTSLLKGRLWQAAKWSENFRQAATNAAENIQEAFQEEKPAEFVLKKIEKRWRQVHAADTDTKPGLRLVEHRFEEFVRKAEFTFYPDEAGQERLLDELSDGQRSLFHIALTAATLEMERDAFALSQEKSAFDQEKLRRTHLTVLAIEEPENSLSPFFLSRIVQQVRDIGSLDTAQVLLASHSAAILSRIEPEEVRYLRIERRKSFVHKLLLPQDDEEARKYIRLAVKAYPELYFARSVILAEGDSEQIVIPRIADAMGVPLDPSFVPVVPLGGRYCMHFWKLLSDLKIPYVTLLDFDIGRQHGGVKIFRDVIANLAEVGVDLKNNKQVTEGKVDLNAVERLQDNDLWPDGEDNPWIQALEEEGVFFSSPLDLDFSMLNSFPTAYQHPNPGGRGPSSDEKALENAKEATLKTKGNPTLYNNQYEEQFRWYPYLFLRRSKPEAHLAALTRIADDQLLENAPASLKALINHVKETLGLGEDDK